MNSYTWELKSGDAKTKKAAAASALGPSARSGHRMVAYKHKVRAREREEKEQHQMAS